MNKKMSIVTMIVLGLILNCFVLVGHSIAQNKSVSAGGRLKVEISNRAIKDRKINKKSKNKNKEMRDQEEDEGPRIVKLAPRSNNFQPEGPISYGASSFGITPTIRNLPESKESVLKQTDVDLVIREEENNEVEVQRSIAPGFENYKLQDPFVGKSRNRLSLQSPQAMPGPALSFNGILSSEVAAAFGTTSMPPDTVGDVGPNHYVQATNIGDFRVFNKSGAPLTALARISTLFSGLPAGDICRTSDSGDPVVNYDPLADRWLISQFYTSAPFGQCIAVSKTGDPTGAWYVYNFPTPNGNFPDYPHWAVWTDGYYLSTHEFNAAGTAYIQAGFYAFNRRKMIAGDRTANYIYFSDANSFGHLPADVDGYVPPPAGTSEYFMEYDSAVFTGGLDRLIIHELVPNFTTPASSTFILKSVAIAPHDPRDPSGRTDIEQPVVPSTSYLDAVGGRNMFRLAYRNLGTAAAPVNSYVTNWTVNVSGVAPVSAATFQAGVRWEELRRDGAGVLSVFDQGTHAPDPVSGTGRNRWAGSIAQDNQGNIGLGFSRSGIGATDFPDIVWAGRTNNVTNSSMLNEGEATMHASTGYQNINNSRWGDYSSMTVDPTDDCTFWFTSEWRDSANNSSAGNAPFFWSTRIGNFKFPACTAAPKGQITATVTNCQTGLPVNNAAVTADPGTFLRTTNSSGNLLSNIITTPGTYTVTASRKGYATTSSAMVNVTDGNLSSAGTLCVGNGFPVIELTTAPSPPAVQPTDQNGNGRLDPGETASLNIPLLNDGGLDATAVSATLSTTTPGVDIIAPQTLAYPDLVKEGGTGNSAAPFKFRLAQSFPCGGSINFTLTVNYNGTNAAQTINFTINTPSASVNISTTLDTTAPPSGTGYTATTGTQTGRLFRSGVASTCAAAKAAPGLGSTTTGARQYDAYVFTASSTGCFTVTLTSTNGVNLYSAAYNNSGFVPANPNTNFLADPGGSNTTVTYSFNVTAGQNFTVVVHDINVTPASNSAYTLNVSGSIVNGCTTFAPTAARVPVSGRVTVEAKHAGLSNAVVVLTDSNGNTSRVLTSSFGYYSFSGVEVGQTYTVSVESKKYRFTPQVISIEDTLADVNFYSTESRR